MSQNKYPQSVRTVLESTALNCSPKKPFALTVLIVSLSVGSNTPVGAQQQFRDPQLPTQIGASNVVDSGVAQSPAGVIQTSIPAGAGTPSQDPQGFVPPAAPETRLRPILPRSESLSNSLRVEGSFQPPVTVLEFSGQGNSISGYDETTQVIPGKTDLRSIIEGTLKPDARAVKEPRGPEVVTQRYPDGKPQLIKEVAQDSEGNYYNHGDWKLLNRRGQTLAEGQFKNGVMDGIWRRWHPQGAGGIFSTRPFNMFKGPFLSTAKFSDGQLDGVWTLSDSFERKIFEIPYQNGIRNGTASWWFPDSTKMREVAFRNGLIDGTLQEWNEQHKSVRYDEFIQGKKIVRLTSYYRPKKKLDENYFLDSKLELTGEDDWWQAQPAGFETTGTRVQHGPALAWWDNDQQKMKGQYQNDVRIGLFTWWHPNGQKALQGHYDETGNKIGNWVWWHPNGIKSIQGQYQDDVPSGFWMWWDTSGIVTSKENMDDREAVMSDPDELPTSASHPDPADKNTNDDGTILSTPDEFDALEVIEPFGEGSQDILPDQNDSNDATSGESPPADKDETDG